MSAKLPLFLILASASAFAQDNAADSFCNTRFLAAPDTLAWRLDQGRLAEAINSWDTSTNEHITSGNAHIFVDRTIQNISRNSRARIRHRVIPFASSCSALDWNGDACITAHTNGESNACLEFPGSAAWGGCSGPLTGCTVHFCSENISDPAIPGVWGVGLPAMVLTHELGHALGLDHVIEDDGFTCSQSDGCESELMCPTGNAANLLRDGDSKGVRERYNGNALKLFNRELWHGARASSDAPRGSSYAGSGASYPPRLACSSFNNGNTNCVMLVHDQVGDTSQRTRLVALITPTVSSWSATQTVITSSLGYTLPGDVAIDPYGAEALYTRVRPSSTLASVTATRVDLTTGAVSVRDLGYSSLWPVRATYNDDLGGFVVVGVSKSASIQVWRAHLVRFENGALTAEAIAFNPQGIPAADFDFDCRFNIFGPTDCVLASPLFAEEAGGGVGRVFSRVFRLSGGVGSRIATFQGGWARSALADAQAVIGLTLSPSAMHISAGVTRLGGTTNTASLQYPSLSVASTPTESSFERGDASSTSCSDATSTGNFSMGASTPHGGHSLAWCPTCTSNKLRSLHLGKRTDNDTFCF